MDFFGLGASERNPVSQMVDRATDDMLMGADWSTNMEICDAINSRTEGPEWAAKAIRRRLGSDKPKVVQLALTLVETCVKNCGFPFHAVVGTNNFLDAVIALASACSPRHGSEVQEQALDLIQQWGRAFEPQREALPAFAAAYERLRREGARFSTVDDAGAGAHTHAHGLRRPI